MDLPVFGPAVRGGEYFQEKLGAEILEKFLLLVVHPLLILA